MNDAVVERPVHRALAKLLIPTTAGVLILGGCAYPADPVVPAASPSSTTVIVQPASTVQRVYTYPEGRYQLYGNGTAETPYYWVWMPAGVTAPPPPPLPRIPAP